MSPHILDQSALAAVLSESGWADIDQFYLACKERNVFGAEFYDRAIERAMKAEIRRMLRKGVVRDGAGRTIRVASIVIKDDNSVERRVYKQETLFDVADCVQVISYWKRHRDRCNDRIRYYRDLSLMLHGPQVQGMLPIDDDDPALLRNFATGLE